MYANNKTNNLTSSFRKRVRKRPEYRFSLTFFPVLFLYRKMQVSENPYYSIFYAVVMVVTYVKKNMAEL